jgi:hypothetical protein
MAKEHHIPEAERLSDYEDLLVDAELEGSIVLPPSATSEEPPALPQRSQKRVSRMLDNVIIELQSLDGSTPAEEKAETLDPHEWYLSSEEDGSVSEYDDEEDSLVEFGPPSGSEVDTLHSRSSRSSSMNSDKDTVRAISYKPAGKPRIVDIRLRKPPAPKQASITSDMIPTVESLHNTYIPAPLRLASSASSLHRISMSSIESTVSEPSNRSSQLRRRESKQLSLPLRRVSRLSSSTSSLTTPTKRAFLSSEHLPQRQASAYIPSSTETTQTKTPPRPKTPKTPKTPKSPKTPKTPKTPISQAAALWMNGLGRTLSMAQRPPMPRLSIPYNAGASLPRMRTASRPGLAAVVEEEHAEDAESWNHRVRSATTPQTRHEWTARYPGLAKPSRVRPLASVKERSMSLGVRGIRRRKSVKGRSERYLG